MLTHPFLSLALYKKANTEALTLQPPIGPAKVDRYALDSASKRGDWNAYNNELRRFNQKSNEPLRDYYNNQFHSWATSSDSRNLPAPPSFIEVPNEINHSRLEVDPTHPINSTPRRSAAREMFLNYGAPAHMPRSGYQVLNDGRVYNDLELQAVDWLDAQARQNEEYFKKHGTARFGNIDPELKNMPQELRKQLGDGNAGRLYYASNFAW